MVYNNLFQTYRLGDIELSNRAVMAPMTRCRAVGNVPQEIMAEYYAQRAGAGLIITEGTSPSPNGLGYPRIPGIFNRDQVASWRLVTDAVHKNRGRIYVQLMHTGRVGHPLNLPKGARLLGPSAVAAPGKMFTDTDGMQDQPAPTPMTEDDIEQAIQEFVEASQNAIDAGFDGVELHGANGYLIDQFLNRQSNHRKDRWGGDVEGRARFAIEIAKAVSQKIGAKRVGMRLSPAGGSCGMEADEATPELYNYLARELSEIGIAYIHLVDHSSMGSPVPEEQLVNSIKRTFKGTLIRSGGYDSTRAETDISAERCELVAFGKPYLANPDLLERFRSGKSLNQADFNTFYTDGKEGYLDYPTA